MTSQIVQLSTLHADTAMQAETKSLRPESVNTIHDAEAQQPEKGGPPPGPSVPDGGWRAWSVVMGSWFIIFATFGYVSLATYMRIEPCLLNGLVCSSMPSVSTRRTTRRTSVNPTQQYHG
jgi:hypothetical protein